MSGGIALVGAGGHAKVVVATLRAAGRAVTACYDDDQARWASDVLGAPVRGPITSLAGDADASSVVIAIGSNEARRRWAGDLAVSWADAAVHPRACVDETARLGPGSVVFAGAVVQPDARIGAHVIVNTCASVDHDCRIGDFAHLAPGCRLAGGVEIGEGAFLGIGAVAIPGVRIGAWARVGAGAVVIRDVEPGATVVGVPAAPRPARPSS